MATSDALEPFPYKTEFIDPDEIWKTACELDLAHLQIIPEVDRNTKAGWRSIPRTMTWHFKLTPNGKAHPYAFVSKDGQYDLMNKLSDYFSDEARMHARRKGRPSPVELYQSHYVELLAIAEASKLEAEQASTKERWQKQDMPLRYWLREAIYRHKLKPECTTFKMSVSKALFKHFGSQRVLDGSAGWGNRLLGAAVASVPIYHGYDVNERMRQPYQKMLEFIASKNPSLQYQVTIADFLKATLPVAYYDTFFSSPPYFDFELYSDDAAQSTNQFQSLSSWTHSFLLPYVKQGWQALAPGGHYCLYLNDIKDCKYVMTAIQYLNQQLHAKFLGVIAVTDEDLAYAFPIWVWQK